VTLLLPNSGVGSSKFEVKEVEAIGGRAFEISHADHCDLVMLREVRSPRVETVRMVSDCNLSWARFSRNGDRDLVELLVMDGQRIDLDGKKILSSAQRISYLVASRMGERFQVETSEGLMELDFPMGDLQQRLSESSHHAAVRK
jgi:hypothetical protein